MTIKMTKFKYVAILLSSLLGARAQTATTLTIDGETFTFGDGAGTEAGVTSTTEAGGEATGVVDATSSASAVNVVHTSITSAAEATTAAAGDLATVSITAAPGYQVAQACVQECLYFYEEGLNGGLLLPQLLGCYSTVYNACYCTAAITSKASSIISSCINEWCSGTSQIPDAISVYDAYCTSAGYPANAAANDQTAATTTTANNPQVTVVTSNIVLTLTVGSSTFLYTEPVGVKTVTNSPSTTTSNPNSADTSSNGKSKVPVGGIVGGVVGALVLIGILLALLFWWLRKQKKRALAEEQNENQQESTFVPVTKRGGGRAELQGMEKGIPMVDVGVVEKVEEKEVIGKERVVSGVEIDGRGRGEMDGTRYGLRPEELDSEGRYMGELHGDGRHFTGVELEGSEVVR